MKIRPKAIWTMSLEGECQTDTRTVITARDIPVTLDEPIASGGTNLGHMPMEALIVALIGCTNVISNKIARANDIEILDMSVRADATANSAGTRLIEETDIPFPEITLHIALTSGSDDGKIDILKRDLPRYCAISKVLQQAGTKVTEVWTVTRP